MIELKVNDQMQQVDVEADTPLLWVIREQLNLIGTKFGCGMAQCGACTVHLNGQPIRSCVTPISAVAGQAIITIEGIADDSANLTKVQQA
ncbi:MAG: isoquinoline 1-oxidoreductase alpha subunit [Paraglaciecola sp.]|jgi:isoquinoline 1-oxidoreductase alpha subunit